MTDSDLIVLWEEIVASKESFPKQAALSLSVKFDATPQISPLRPGQVGDNKLKTNTRVKHTCSRSHNNKDINLVNKFDFLGNYFFGKFTFKT